MPEVGISRDDFLDFWGRALALDTLISNTDRHAENWAVVRSPDGARMAALYDNGSSMGCGIDQIGLGRAFEKSGQIKNGHLQRQRQNGCHHLRLKGPAKRGGSFEEVSVAFLSGHSEGRRWFEAAADIDIGAIRALMDHIATVLPLPAPHGLCEMRRQHICAMLQIGVERIRNVLCRV